MALNATAAANVCLIVQKQLENIMGDTAPGSIQKPTGMLDALLSPLNRNGFEAIPTKEFEGKGMPVENLLPKIEIKYELPDCAEADETEPTPCGSDNNATLPWGFRQFNMNPANVLSSEFQVTQGTFDRVCERRDDTISVLMRKHMDRIVNSLEKKMIELVYANAGNYAEGISSVTTPKELLLYGVTTGQPYANPAAFLELNSQYRRMFSDNKTPIIVGDDALARYFDMRGLAGLGQNSLHADPRFGGAAPFISLFMDTVLNPGQEQEYHGLSWLPGTTQLVTWNKFKGEWAELEDPRVVRTTMQYRGLEFDYTMYKDPCGPTWYFTVSLHYDLFAITSSEMTDCYDFNYILHWLFDCGDSTCANLLPTLLT